MKKFLTMYSGSMPTQLVPLNDEIMVRPGQSLTIEETLKRFGQHGTLRQNAGFHFYDDQLETDTSKMTFEQLHEYSQQVGQHAERLRRAAAQKAHDDHEAATEKRIELKLNTIREQEKQAAQPAGTI